MINQSMHGQWRILAADYVGYSNGCLPDVFLEEVDRNISIHTEIVGICNNPFHFSYPESFSFRQQSMVPLRVASHGAEDVPVYANGPMAHLFHGVYEQNYILHAMTYASCMDSSKKHCKDRAKEAKLISGGATFHVTSLCFVNVFLSMFL
jgi:hypothetical protein